MLQVDCNSISRETELHIIIDIIIIIIIINIIIIIIIIIICYTPMCK